MWWNQSVCVLCTTMSDCLSFIGCLYKLAIWAGDSNSYSYFSCSFNTKKCGHKIDYIAWSLWVLNFKLGRIFQVASYNHYLLLFCHPYILLESRVYVIISLYTAPPTPCCSCFSIACTLYIHCSYVSIELLDCWMKDISLHSTTFFCIVMVMMRNVIVEWNLGVYLVIKFLAVLLVSWKEQYSPC